MVASPGSDNIVRKALLTRGEQMPTVNIEKCNGCGSCEDVCPVEAIEIENGKAVIGSECVECGTCVDECPNGAMEE